MDKITQNVGFVGAGQMARALAAGFVRAGLLAEKQIIASDIHPGSLEAFRQALPGSRTVADNKEVASAVDIVVLAVKPQNIDGVLDGLYRAVQKHPLMVSIAAGVSIKRIAKHLGGTARIVRVMPNTACLIGQGAIGYALGPGATPADGELVARLLGAVGRAIAVDESLLDAVTGLSGSGPGFVYLVIEALADGAVRMGLPRDQALLLAAQTVRGAAEMVLTTGEHPAVLKDRVTSPGGTTLAGLHALERGGLRATLIDAVEAATRRSIELGTYNN